MQYATVRPRKKHFFVNSEILGMHILRKTRLNYDKFDIATNCVNQIFNLNAFFFFLFTRATWYYHTICLVITYFASFTDYKDDIFEDISNWRVQEPKFGGKINNFGVHGVFFFQVWLEGNLVKALNHCRLENIKKLMEP